MADINKRILLHLSLQLYLSPNTPILFGICKNVWNVMWGVGGEGNWWLECLLPLPLPYSHAHACTPGVNYLVVLEFLALRMNKWNCKIASPHLTTKASWIFTLKRFNVTQVVSWTHERRSKTTFIINMTSWLARDKTFIWAMLLSGSNSKQILSFLPKVYLPQSRAHSSYERKWNLNFGLIVLRLRNKFKERNLETYWILPLFRK